MNWVISIYLDDLSRLPVAAASKDTLRRAGVRPFLQGVLLWAVIATPLLLAIRAGWIAL
ncbi:MAG: hypothetical protein WCC04_02895 [Terriglobales bacterium]